LAKDASYRVKYRRRREGRTDYRARRFLTTSGRSRLVVRSTLKSLYVQLVLPGVEGDQVLVSSSSRELGKDFGWKGGPNNVPAAYLLGLMAGYRARAEGLDSSMLDMDLKTPTKGARVFAVVKGAVDSGFDVTHSEEVLPSDERIRGEHIADYGRLLLADVSAYKSRFSKYLARGLKPEDLPDHFDDTKARIVEAGNR